MRAPRGDAGKPRSPELWVGTSGYSYAEWKGSFYPERLAARGMLRFYAGRLPAVEINNTFYRMPRTEVLEAWAAQVPDDFRFALKASRRITHFKRLRGVEDETAYLLRSVGSLGDRLGALLFQLPPNLARDLARLDAFLALLPEGLPAAFEFRHPSWRDEAVWERLRARDCALVHADGEGAAEGGEEAPEPVSTATWGYLRLRRPGYARRELADWALRVARSGWQRAFVFFKHEDAGAGPRLAAEFRAIAQRGGEGTGRPSRARRRPVG